MSDNEGEWFRVVYVDGCVVNTLGLSEQHVRNKSQQYHQGVILSVDKMSKILKVEPKRDYL
jgi:hypothetical protein